MSESDILRTSYFSPLERDLVCSGAKSYALERDLVCSDAKSYALEHDLVCSGAKNML